MIYDGFMLFNELDLLDIRMGILHDYVNKFVIVESTKTFTGKEKPLYYNENKNLFSQYSDKIIHIIFDETSHQNPWNNEYAQRNAIAKGFIDLNDNDYAMLSDVDEIPDPVVISRVISENHEIVRTEQRLYYYYLNCLKLVNWGGTLIFKKRILNYNSPQDLRHHRTDSTLPVFQGGWHYSYMGGSENIKKKLESFSEVQDNNARNRDIIEDCVQAGIDHLTGSHLTLDNDNVPQYIMKNKQKYSHLLKTSDFKFI